MEVNSLNLVKLEKEYKDYLEGNIIDRFFDDFGINFASGHWAAEEASKVIDIVKNILI